MKEWQKSKPAAAQLWELQCACVSRREVLLTGDDEAYEMPVKKLSGLLKNKDILPSDIPTVETFPDR